MRETLKTIATGLLAAFALVGTIYFFVRMETDNPKNQVSVQDSVAIKKELEKPVVESGQVISTVENCKLYRLKTRDDGFIYLSICYDSLGRGISTGIK